MELVSNIGLSEVQAAWSGVKKLDANPLRLAGRLAGLGSSELEAGVPTWAWITVAFGAGALLTFAFNDKISRKMKALF